jgi:1-aminocyclopropane-1-carboxylate deaminase
LSLNKFRKLKYNLLQAKKNQGTLLTFGAYSNHIAAVAFAGKEKGFKTIGIRG